MTERMRRVNESVRAVVADAVAVSLQDPRKLGIVTVTGVSVSPDTPTMRASSSPSSGARRNAPRPSPRSSLLGASSRGSSRASCE